MKRQIAYFLVVFVGFLALTGHFINYAPLNDFIDNDATQWFDIIAGFAAFLGVINLFKYILRLFQITLSLIPFEAFKADLKDSNVTINSPVN